MNCNHIKKAMQVHEEMEMMASMMNRCENCGLFFWPKKTEVMMVDCRFRRIMSVCTGRCPACNYFALLEFGLN